MPIPWIFTFYSFKGGVGRSLAAANVAYTLASWGRHVLIVDMDLEAPGLSGFLDRAGELAPPQTARQNDILTLLTEFIAASRSGVDPDAIVRDLQPVSGYIRRVDPEKLRRLAPKMGEVGRLDVLGIDQNRKYSERLASLGLRNLDHDELVKVSRLLRSYLKAQRFPHRPLWLESFRPAESVPYDYVIVDSRTGFTEIGGLCVGPLADRLVVVTGLNDQNVEGTRSFLQEVGIKLEARPKNQEGRDSDEDPENGSGADVLGPKPTIIVASPVPAGEIEAKRRRLKTLEERLGVLPEQISYHPQMALVESLFVRDYQEEYLASQYRRLADRVQSLVGDNEDRLLKELNALLSNWEKNTDWPRAVGLATRLAPLSASGRALVSLVKNLIDPTESSLAVPLHALLSQEASTKDSALTDWGRALSDQANDKEGEEADWLFTVAYAKYAEAVGLTPDNASALNNWGAALSDQAKGKEAEEADPLFATAYEKYAEAVRLKPDYADALSNWGNALSDQAKAKNGDETDRLFKEAYEKFAEAVRLKPDAQYAWSNWGAALSDQASIEAKREEGDEADRLFAAAYQKYTEANKLNPVDAEALSNWGAALTDQAEMKVGDEADRLFTAAYGKFTEAVRLNPQYAAALSSWGNALADQAGMKEGEDADALFMAAYEKYAEAVRLKPNHAYALSSWGAALLDQAKKKRVLSRDGPQSEALLTLARTKLLDARTKGSRESLPYLARLEATCGDVNKAISWLREAIESGKRITNAELASDSYFDAVRQNPDFVQFAGALPDK
jgi:cytochrome c-type biogenesis protein CcmH/NrfG